jgi:hypothetical protein
MQSLHGGDILLGEREADKANDNETVAVQANEAGPDDHGNDDDDQQNE